MVGTEDLKPRTHLALSFTTNLESRGKNYAVVTEKTGGDEVMVVSSVYFKGNAISQYTEACGAEIDPMDVQAVEREVRKLHFRVISDVESGQGLKDKKPRDYIEESKKLLRRRNNEGALAVLAEGHGLYPDDPFILSYYGCLTSAVRGRHKEGIEACQRALDKLAQKFPVGLDSSLKPVFYLNLCRAQLASGDKKTAVETIHKGMRFDTEEGILHNELVKLGVRRRPFFNFLKRSNPINKYIGKILHKMYKGG